MENRKVGRNAMLAIFPTSNLPRGNTQANTSNPSGDQNRPFIVKFRINWALSNSLNTYNRHSDWHKLEVYATNVSIYFRVLL